VASRKYEIAVDVPHNRLYVILRGFLSAVEIREGGRRIMDVLPRLRDGFDVVTDLSEYLATRGMRRAVRVVPPAFAALLQMWRTSRELGYSAEVAVSIADAQKLLDAAPRSPAPAAPAS
jgi:hypothetical protein